MDLKNLNLLRTTIARVNGLHDEFLLLVKKDPSDRLGTFKINFVNLILMAAIPVLNNEALRGCDALFNAEDPPTVSDVRLVLAQFVECAEVARLPHIEPLWGVSGGWVWSLDNVPTTPPRVRKAA